MLSSTDQILTSMRWIKSRVMIDVRQFMAKSFIHAFTFNEHVQGKLLLNTNAAYKPSGAMQVRTAIAFNESAVNDLQAEASGSPVVHSIKYHDHLRRRM